MQSEFSCEQCRDQLPELLDNSLNVLQKQLVDQHLTQCDACNETLQQFWQLQSLSARWHDESVPHWARRETFFTKHSWFPKLQLVSTFATLFVLVLVLAQAQITTKNGFSISFGGETYLTQDQLNQQLAVIQADLQAEQRDQLQTDVSNLTTRQAATNQLLLRTILQQSRDERHEELDYLVSSWNLQHDQQLEQTQQGMRALLVNQIEDRRNIKQLNRALTRASLEGSNL